MQLCIILIACNINSHTPLLSQGCPQGLRKETSGRLQGRSHREPEKPSCMALFPSWGLLHQTRILLKKKKGQEKKKINQTLKRASVSECSGLFAYQNCLRMVGRNRKLRKNIRKERKKSGKVRSVKSASFYSRQHP